VCLRLSTTIIGWAGQRVPSSSVRLRESVRCSSHWRTCVIGPCPAYRIHRSAPERTKFIGLPQTPMLAWGDSWPCLPRPADGGRDGQEVGHGPQRPRVRKDDCRMDLAAGTGGPTGSPEAAPVSAAVSASPLKSRRG
jgi:hypothetical protein